MFKWLKRQAKTVTKFVPVLRAGYDAADSKHYQLWPTADSLAANAVADPEVRRTLRERARDQVANDSLAEGIVDTLVTDLIGTGPRLRMLLEDDDANDAVEDSFAAWWRTANITDKLALLVRARIIDGEGVGVFIDNPSIDHPVTLDVRNIECDRVANPFPKLEPDDVDGIKIDANGNPVIFMILKQHPGDVMQRGFGYEADEVPAEFVLHYFRQRRPEQHRGVSELAPALIRFARLHRYGLAVLLAAEVHAAHAGVMSTEATPDDTEPVEAKSTMEARPGQIVALPAGYKLQAFQPTQPQASYAEYRRAVIGEIARGWSLPVGRALGDYSDSSYASGKLDHMSYLDFVKAERERLARRILDRIFAAWVAEAVLRSDLFPVNVRTMLASGDTPHEWRWPATIQLHGANPLQEAKASTERMNNGTSNQEVECAELGRDWQEIREQEYVKAKFDRRMEKKYGVTLNPPTPAESGEETEEEGEDA